jgi:hypothetical protein
MPTGKPWIEAQPVTSVVPYSGLNSSKREPSTMRAITSRMSKGTRSARHDAEQLVGVVAPAGSAGARSARGPACAS